MYWTKQKNSLSFFFVLRKEKNISPSLLVQLYDTVCTRHGNIEIRESRLQLPSKFLLTQKLCSGSYETPYSSVKFATSAMVICTSGK